MYEGAMAIRQRTKFEKLVMMLLACTSTFGCKKKEPSNTSQTTRAATQAPEAAPSGGGVLVGLDECLVGKFEAEKVVLKLNRLSAEGGSKVEMQIASNGATTIDFTPMSEIHATADRGLAFNFKYAGTATSTLKTPARGTIVSESTNLDALRVNSTINLPGAGAVQLFKDTPVKELARMATAIAGSLPKGADATAAANPASGIDASPIFSSSHYTCEGDTLTLDNAQGAATWTFKRKP